MKEAAFSVELRHKRETVYDITLNNFPTVSGVNKVDEQLENCMCYFNGMRLTNLYHESEKHTVKMSDFLTNVYAVFRIVADQYKGMVYLGPLRENPRREYSVSSIRTVQDSTGADAPFVLAKNQRKKLKKEINPPLTETSVYKGYKRDKIEMRGDRAEISDFPLYLNTVAGGLDCRDQTIGGFSFVVKIYAVPVVEIIG